MKAKVCRISLCILIFLSFGLTFVGCGPFTEDDIEWIEVITYDDQLQILQALTPAKIQKIDFVYVRPENGGTRVYKTFTETSDLQAVLDALKSANLQTVDNQNPQGGWTVLLRIWLLPAVSGRDKDPLLISTGGDTTVYVGDYAYAAENEAYYTDLIALYETSAAEEMPYNV